MSFVPQILEDLATDTVIVHPYSDSEMIYDPVQQKYFITSECLLNNDIDLENDLEGYSPKRVQTFLNKTTNTIYSYSKLNSGSNMATLKYIIAKGLCTGYSEDQFRTEFKNILVNQAKYYLDNGDIRSISGVYVDSGRFIRQSTMRAESRHISAEVIDVLYSLGLLYAGTHYKSYSNDLTW